jgi:chorismate-pyruvate lyase
MNTLWQQPGTLQIPAALQSWVDDAGSLTRRLQSHGQFRVQLLHQAFEAPTLEEQRLLGARMRQLAIVREVALHLDNEIVVLARSILPVRSIKGTIAFSATCQDVPSAPNYSNVPLPNAPLAGYAAPRPPIWRNDSVLLRFRKGSRRTSL